MQFIFIVAAVASGIFIGYQLTVTGLLVTTVLLAVVCYLMYVPRGGLASFPGMIVIFFSVLFCASAWITYFGVTGDLYVVLDFLSKNLLRK